MNRESLIDFIKSYVAELTSLPAHDIDVDSPLERYGLDSIGAAGLSGHLSDALRIELSPDMAYDYPTIASIADYLLGLMPDMSASVAAHGNAPGSAAASPFAAKILPAGA
jgi:polyketide synthase 13